MRLQQLFLRCLRKLCWHTLDKASHPTQDAESLLPMEAPVMFRRQFTTGSWTSGLLLVFAQGNNLSKIRAMGGATIVDIAVLSSNIKHLQTHWRQLFTSSYRESMQRPTRLNKDQPMKPLDWVVLWIKFDIKEALTCWHSPTKCPGLFTVLLM